MTFQEKVKQMNIFDLISTKEITYLKDIDRRIKINKSGKFQYSKFNDVDTNKIWCWLYELEENYVYTVIPLISASDRPDEPYVILSQQMLVSHKSNALLLGKYINNKIIDSINLYNMREFEGIIIFKFKVSTLKSIIPYSFINEFKLYRKYTKLKIFL